jgi:hypothetical protein
VEIKKDEGLAPSSLDYFSCILSLRFVNVQVLHYTDSERRLAHLLQEAAMFKLIDLARMA